MQFNTKCINPIFSACLAICLSSSIAFANEVTEDSSPLKTNLKKGCYTVKRATLIESSVDAKNVVGNYKLILQSSNRFEKESIFISGPLSGAESGSEESASVSSTKAAAETGPHGGHNFGTDHHVGTFSTEGDTIEVTSASCPSGNGTPQFIKGIETLNFVKGTGVFTNLVSGKIKFNLTYDACNNKNNPVAVLEATQGQVCFK